MHLKRLGPYEIGKPLGKGGMGSVYEAVDTNTGQRVAVKVLSPHLAMAEGFRERFEAEIDSLKTLRHDGIVRLYGYGEQDGALFYSMEVVDGVSLEDELKAGRRFTWREVTSIAIQLCLALKHAHDHGIIHRDIKPANILLYDDDKVKLADFGIARLFGTTQLTTAGGVLGTADYMSPEQADGRPVTARCDQYSLGGVMFALLAGRPPFRAKSLPQMLQMQRFAQPEPVRRYAPDTPEQLEQVIAQLLSKDPGDRYPNTQVLARHLRAMFMALSRPAPDDFALANEKGQIGPAHPDWEHSLVIAPTQAERDFDTPARSLAHAVSDQGDQASPSQVAVTLAADELASSGKVASGASSQAPPMTGSASDTPPSRIPVKVSRFTTIEEEEARQHSEQQRSWLVAGLQLAALIALLLGMGWLVLNLSQPLSADALYQTIRAAGDANGKESLDHIESEVDEFLTRFGDDPRSSELIAYRERIALDKLERRLQSRLRSKNGGDSLLPVELLYLQAERLAEESQIEAARMLESLVDLYAVDGRKSQDRPELAPRSNRTKQESATDEAQERQAAVVRLAERRLGGLREGIALQSKQQSEMLKERIETAAGIETSEPERAAAMYRAIVDLYSRDDWAQEYVTTARKRLAELE